MPSLIERCPRPFSCFNIESMRNPAPKERLFQTVRNRWSADDNA
jgi:hypothetical protein